MNSDEVSSCEYQKFKDDFDKYVSGNLRTSKEAEYMQTHEDEEAILTEKLENLRELIASSKHMVVYTGAGVSTECGLPDYRGKDGVWTKRAKGEKYDKFDVNNVSTGFTHKWIAEGVKEGRVKHVISTNVDNLHVKSGLVRKENLSELHGNLFIGECRGCGKEFKLPNPLQLDDTTRLEHTITPPIPCSVCSEPLCDNVVSFHSTFEDVPSMEAIHDAAWVQCIKADLLLVLGSSLSVPSACDLIDTTHEKGGKVVIVNRQRTPKDRFAVMNVFADCADVVRQLPW
eukprot:TRINITY_DN6944_c0_g1_i1.p1 TRINITY_DN6944_c0_g1~~TRINITY_DN6944_c0_g1_i1.p1  ORF type:complete len:286 (+),score=43.67 TRINITY_DN6944_c0_g1_i1:50-907(+)